MLQGIIVIDAFLVASLGEEALAAMGLAAAIAGIVLGFLFAFSSGTQIRVAQSFGAGDPQRLKTGFYCGLIINLAVAFVGIILIVVFGQSILASFAHTPWIAEQAFNFLLVFLVVILFEAISLSLATHFNASGNTRVTLYGYLISLPINLLFSIVLIHGLLGAPELGLVGAAVGSAIASIVHAIYLSWLFYGENRAFVDVNGWSNGTFGHSIKRHLNFSLPIAGTFISSTLSAQVCMLLYAKMTVNQFAAMTIIMPWIKVIGTFSISWAQATGILMAQRLGNKTPSDALDRFLSTAWRGAFVAAALVSLIYGLLCLASGRIYPNLQAETTAALLGFLPILMLLPFPKSSNAICGNTLRASGDTVYVMNLFVGSQWLVTVPLTALFVLYFELSVFWVFAVLLFEEIVKFPAFHLRIYQGEWKNRSIDPA